MIEAILYCDASVKAGFCGIGLCLLDINGNLIEKKSKRMVDHGTNNTAGEASAILEGIKLAARHGFTKIRIYTDSKSLVQVANTGKGSTKTTRRFISALSKLKTSIQVSIKWVRGHAKQKWNCMCDRLARKAQWTMQDHIMIFWNKLCGNFGYGCLV